MNARWHIGAAIALGAATELCAAGDAALTGAPQLDFVVLLAIALVPPVALWCGLAARRAARDDLSRGPRRARRVLLRLLEGARSGAEALEAEELARWQTGVRELWQLAEEAPTPAAVGGRGGKVWAQLWDEAEAAMFSRQRALPRDWLERAISAASAMQPQRTASRWPRRARHWIPLLVLGVVTLRLPEGRAQTARESMAERGAAALPGERGQWDAAHAQWLKAFLSRPRDPEVRAELRVSLERVAAPDPALRRMLAGKWHERIASWATAREWTRLALAGAGLIAAGASLWLALAYAGGARWWRATGIGVAVIGGVAAATGSVAFRSFGVMVHPQLGCVVATAEVRPVASDVGARQDAATLLPGTLVVIDRSFLGWDHVISADGTISGWLRQERAKWIYRVRDEGLVSEAYSMN